MSAHAIPLYRQDERHPQVQACGACEVRGAALFGGLDDAGLDRIHTHIAGLTLEPDVPVYGRGAAGPAVYTVRAGVVRFERTTARGDRRIVRLAGWNRLVSQLRREAMLQPCGPRGARPDMPALQEALRAEDAA